MSFTPLRALLQNFNLLQHRFVVVNQIFKWIYLGITILIYFTTSMYSHTFSLITTNDLLLSFYEMYLYHSPICKKANPMQRCETTVNNCNNVRFAPLVHCGKSKFYNSSLGATYFIEFMRV